MPLYQYEQLLMQNQLLHQQNNSNNSQSNTKSTTLNTEDKRILNKITDIQSQQHLIKDKYMNIREVK